jgi:hypothetical protein
MHTIKGSLLFFSEYIFLKFKQLKGLDLLKKNIQHVTSFVEAGYIVAKNSTSIMVSENQ